MYRLTSIKYPTTRKTIRGASQMPPHVCYCAVCAIQEKRTRNTGSLFRSVLLTPSNRCHFRLSPSHTHTHTHNRSSTLHIAYGRSEKKSIPHKWNYSQYLSMFDRNVVRERCTLLSIYSIVYVDNVEWHFIYCLHIVRAEERFIIYIFCRFDIFVFQFIGMCVALVFRFHFGQRVHTLIRSTAHCRPMSNGHFIITASSPYLHFSK